MTKWVHIDRVIIGNWHDLELAKAVITICNICGDSEIISIQ